MVVKWTRTYQRNIVRYMLLPFIYVDSYILLCFKNVLMAIYCFVLNKCWWQNWTSSQCLSDMPLYPSTLFWNKAT